MVDADLIRRKVAELEEYQRQIEEYHDLTIQQYRSDWKTQRIIDRTLHLMIESCLDVANHVIADRRLKVPATYAETFEILGEASILSNDLRDAMIRMPVSGISWFTSTHGLNPVLLWEFFASISATSRASAPPF